MSEAGYAKPKSSSAAKRLAMMRKKK